MHRDSDESFLGRKIIMSEDKRNTAGDLVKNTSKQASELLNKTADTANEIIKNVSGEGGLVGKVSDTSSDLVKNVSNTGHKVVGKTVDTASKAVKGATDKLFKKK
jgi:cell division septum initiation protein DivIVA